VDFHTHAFPERVAARAVQALAAEYGVRPVADPTVAGLSGIMDEAGVEVAVIAPVATRPEQVPSINDWAAGVNGPRLVAFGALHPGLERLEAEVERLAALGLRGIKLQPNFQEFAPDDPRLWPAYEAAAGRLVVLFHSGQEIAPRACVHAQPSALARVHEAFPALRMVVAHMGGYQMWREVREHLLGEDIHFDLSYCPEDQLGDDELVALIRAHGAGRVVFATDFPWGDPRADVRRLLRLGLTGEELELIAWRNASALLSLPLE